MIEFYADWCPHCRHMKPVVDNVIEQLGGEVPVHQFDIDRDEELAREANVDTIPTFIVYRDGRVYWSHSGETDSDTLISIIRNAMA